MNVSQSRACKINKTKVDNLVRCFFKTLSNWLKPRLFIPPDTSTVNPQNTMRQFSEFKRQISCCKDSMWDAQKPCLWGHFYMVWKIGIQYQGTLKSWALSQPSTWKAFNFNDSLVSLWSIKFCQSYEALNSFKACFNHQISKSVSFLNLENLDFLLLLSYVCYIYANPWISEVSGVG